MDKQLTDEQIDRHLDAILQASGSALQHHTMQKPKDDMRAAMLEFARAANEQLRSDLAFERSHRNQLQKALFFWLPNMPAVGPEEVSNRIGDDAMLLLCYEGEAEKTAEQLGWISLEATSWYAYLRSRPLDSIHAGGLFVGKTPDNIVINGDDLDAELRTALAKGNV